MDAQSQYSFNNNNSHNTYAAVTGWQEGHVDAQLEERQQQQQQSFRYSLPLSPITPTLSLPTMNAGCEPPVFPMPMGVSMPMSMYAWAANGPGSSGSGAGMIAGSSGEVAAGLTNQETGSPGISVHSPPPRLFPFSQPAFAFNIDYDVRNNLHIHQEHPEHRRRHLHTLQHPYIHQYSTPPTTPTKVPPFAAGNSTNIATTNTATPTTTTNTAAAAATTANSSTSHFNLNPVSAHPPAYSHSHQSLLPQLSVPSQLNSIPSAMYRTSSSPSSSSSSIKRAMSDDEYASPSVSLSSRSHHHHSSSQSTGAGSENANNGSNKTVKRQRACVSTKDFVPPDVTGLSKREARLVKNRAAAFLSRQRKREEFEYMELRVAELEQENARLREAADISHQRSPHSITTPSNDPEEGDIESSEETELDHLRAQLAAAKQREAELAMQLKQHQEVKSEDADDGSSTSTAREDSPFGSPVSFVSGAGAGAAGFRNLVANPKSGASLGLMVLLCALPSLLSSTNPTSASRPSAVQHQTHHPHSHHHSAVNRPSTFLDQLQWSGESPAFFSSSSGEIGWPGSTNAGATGEGEKMEVDCGRFEVIDEAQDPLKEKSEIHDKDIQDREDGEDGEWRKLEIESGEGGAGLFGSTGLDISFVTRRTGDGKIRVKVHSSVAAMSNNDKRSTDPSMSFSSLYKTAGVSRGEMDMTMESMIANAASDLATNPLSLSYVDADPLGPFFGASSLPSPVEAVDGNKRAETGSTANMASSVSTFGNNNDVKRGTGAGLMESAFGHDYPGASLDSSHGYGFGYGGIGDFSSSSGLGYPGYGGYADYTTNVLVPQGKSPVDGEEKKRVRIALKSLPSVGGEGGEWEVEVR